MKRKFTILTAALALFAFLAIPTGMWGQTTVSYGWETSDDATQWTISDAIAATSGEGNTGTYAGKINTNHTYVQFNEKVYVTSFSFAFKRTSNNSNYNVYIETSTDGSTWTAVETYAMSSFSNGTYSTKTHTFDGTTEYYVRFHCYNTTAVRYVDDVAITYNTSAVTVALPTFSPEGGSYTTTQNVTISCETEGSTIYYTTNGSTPDNTSTQYDGAITVSETTTINAIAYVGNDASNVATATYTIVNLEHAGTEADPYSVADARTAIDANVGITGVYATGIVSEIVTAYNSNYGNVTFDIVDELGNTATLRAYRCGGTMAANVAVNDVVVVSGNLTKYNSTYEFAEGCTLVSLTHPSVPSITVTPATLNVDAQEHLVNFLDLAYENIDVENASSFTVHYYNAEGEEIQLVPGESWMIAGVAKPNNDYQVLCVITANEGEARTAYFKLSAVDAENNTVYSNLVTVNQEAYVAPSYAELPFTFNSGRAAIEETDGLSQEGLGTDYSTENTKLKFDGTGDWLLLQFNERPGTLTFSIKNNSFSGGTFTVQTSEDGVTYTDLETYTEITGTQSEEFTDLGENVRYIKWIYTEKVSGNVGLGNIALDAYEVPVIGPSITVNPDNFELDANAHMVEYLTTLAYENIVIVPGSTENFGIQYCDAEGNPTEHSWCGVSVTAVDNSDDFQLVLILATANDSDEARTAYFKVFGHDAEDNLVYSNLVTITQAAPVVDYAVLPFVWEGGASADFLALNGVTAYNLGNDYAAGNAPYLIKFDGTGDYIQVKCDQQPGKVTIGVKMIGGSNTSTITIQGSADGETFTDIEELEISGSQNDELTLETTNVFGENDRYVKMLFTKGSNVGVGPITIEKGNAPSITVTPSTVDLEAAGQVGGTGYQMQSLTVTYNNLEITQAHDFAVQFYNAEGEEQTQPSWIEPDPTVVSGSNDLGYMVMLMIAPNEGPARSAYFKVYALGEDDYVYSNLVTINQAGVAQQYTLTVEPFENLELITFVNDEMVMEADGETQANEGDQIMLSIVAAEGYVMETLMVNGVNHVNDIADDFTYTFEMPAENVTISATAVEDVPGEWVMVSLNDLTENDVFVIVGVYDVDESSFAMPNNSTGAPSAVEVTMVGNTLSGDIDDNLKWNLSIGEDGYTFYPDGETETWLYCTNTNNGVRVGTNENNVFSMTTEGYLFNNATERYIGIYNSQDWRCYTSINNNIKEQTFAFYKRVDESEIETYTLDITGYGNNDGGYYLIASPVSMVRPTDENGILTETYDLYRFDQAQVGEEWRNYKAKKFNLISGKGYLYASQESTTLTFTGIRYNGNGEVALDYTEGASFAGWNLIGNPYSNVEATLYIRVGDVYSVADFYVMNSAGDNFELANRSIYPMEGVFVEATAANEIACFSDGWAPSIQDMKLNLRVSDENGKGDFARVRFGEGNGLEKFMLNPSNTKLYFPMDDADYAVVYTDNMGERPLNFSAAADGDYTLSINSENIEMEYLHLIDNMTGTDVDLLATPSYSFHARVNDNAARFTLVFASLTGVDENATDQFAFFSNGSFIVSNEGNATLQVIDVMGRVLINEQINGSYNKSLNLNAGVYVLRLSKGNVVKTQKVVID